MSAPKKACLRCGVVKPIEDFCRSRQRKDGRYCYCKQCESARVRVENAAPEKKSAKKEYDKARYERLAEQVKAREAARYPLIRERKIAAAKEWVQKNPENRRAVANSYKHRRRSIEEGGVSGAELLRWTKAQERVCHWCGVDCSGGIHVDHVMPFALGGLHEIDNLVISCPPCNLEKNAKHPDVFRAIIEARTRVNLDVIA